jgi:HME family heavy-metal exporter
VIVGGLLTSTLAEFFVRPALFWTIGVGAGKQIVRDHAGDMGNDQAGMGKKELSPEPELVTS